VPLDPRVKRFLDMLGAGDSPDPARRPRDAREASVPERRAQLAELMKLGGPGPAVERAEDTTLAGAAGALPARLYTPCDTAGERPPGILYLHGGGLVAGSLDSHDAIARALAHFSRCRVLSLGYRLAPEHPFPAALEDACAAVRHLAAHADEFGVDGSRLAICGDSAGGTLSAGACQALGGSGLLKLQALLCPILDHTRRDGSRREFASGYLVGQDTLDHDLKHCVPAGADPTDPHLSPLLAEDLSRVPPTLVHTAEFDPLRDEGRDYFERLKHTGSALSYTCHPGMIHLFYGLGAVIPYARTAMERIGEEIRAALSRSSQ
jgi:acetyl esterase